MTQLVENERVAPKIDDSEWLDSLILESLERTSKRLEFSFEKGPQTAEAVGKTGRANCIGYAAFFKFDLEKRLVEKGAAGHFRIEHRRGRLHFLRFDLHRFFDGPFWRDHDFVAVKNVETGFERTVDPSLFDYLDIQFLKR